MRHRGQPQSRKEIPPIDPLMAAPTVHQHEGEKSSPSASPLAIPTDQGRHHREKTPIDPLLAAPTSLEQQHEGGLSNSIPLPVIISETFDILFSLPVFTYHLLLAASRFFVSDL